MIELRFAVPIALLLLPPVAFAASYVSTCAPEDHALTEGPPVGATQGVTTIRIGANSGGRNAVVLFLLPVLGAGEQVVAGKLEFDVAGHSGTPTFNGDLWGIGFQSSTSPILEYFEADTGDPGNTKLQDNILIPSTPNGLVTSTNGAVMGAYLQGFYAANPGYVGGTYAVLRLNPDANAGTGSLGWSISAYENGKPAVLTITTSGGPNNLPPEITDEPDSQAVTVGGNAMFAISATGSGTLGYRWHFQNTPLSDNGRISGATTPTLNINSVVTNDAGGYSVIVTNNFGRATSDVATLTVSLNSAGVTNTTNFIVIVTDDQRWDSLGVVQREMGPAARFPWFTNGTPNLDRLAAGGVRFRNAFVTLSLCSPSRAAILTGRYNHFNGVIDNSTAFPANSVTWASQLRAAGYITGMVGKWHMGTQSARPGFDYYASYLGQGAYEDATFYVNGTATPSTGWVDDVASDYAINFINTYCSNSFGLFLGYKTTHTPHTPPAWAATLYSGNSAQPTPNIGLHAVYRTNVFTPGDTKVLNYHRCVTAMDAGVGRILDRLDELGLATNTMVIFLGDNGFYLGEHGLDDKRTLYEESLRVPMLVRYPRVIPQAAARDELVANIDIAPTILDFAGLPAPTGMQGRSWRPLLEGGSGTDWRQAFLAEYILEPGYEQIPTTVTLRTTGAKFTLWPGHPEWSEMFDLSSDRYEVTNLFFVSAHQAMRDALRGEFDRQMRETGLAAELTRLKFSNGVYSLTVTGGMGPRYELQRSTNLQSWTPLGEVKLNSSQAGFTDPSAGPGRSFYRVRWIDD